MGNRSGDDQLLRALEELTETLEELISSFPETRREPTIRPPTPADLLHFADEFAIPALVAILEANVRALEAFRRVLWLARTERDARERTREKTGAMTRRAQTVRQTTLTSLEAVLGELQQAVSEGSIPADSDARSLLEDARELRDEVDRRLRDVGRDGPSDRPQSGTSGPDVDVDSGNADVGGRQIEIEDGDPDPELGTEDPLVDIDAELETLKDQYAPEKGNQSESDEPTPNDEAVRDEHSRPDSSLSDSRDADPENSTSGDRADDPASNTDVDSDIIGGGPATDVDESGGESATDVTDDGGESHATDDGGEPHATDDGGEPDTTGDEVDTDATADGADAGREDGTETGS